MAKYTVVMPAALYALALVAVDGSSPRAMCLNQFNIDRIYPPYPHSSINGGSGRSPRGRVICFMALNLIVYYLRAVRYRSNELLRSKAAACSEHFKPLHFCSLERQRAGQIWAPLIS